MAVSGLSVLQMIQPLSLLLTHALSRTIVIPTIEAVSGFYALRHFPLCLLAKGVPLLDAPGGKAFGAK
jgi:hypothetical protein